LFERDGDENKVRGAGPGYGKRKQRDQDLDEKQDEMPPAEQIPEGEQ
jgi:hypothetical protein